MSGPKRSPRPDTSKNGLLKRHPLTIRDESVRTRGRAVLSRLGKSKEQQEERK
ncbi:hypothetical protein G3578_15880 [Brevibacillus sp. SYP-B805]|uniref:hypothetical protein n=1 Tax=Brevibacillus sp. SYP-B805 TaxID=1578199 RepID=UPI0013EDF5FC|nr:hypothetical protein [Brevibacillus sp. SYP-B805]NGQ96643.1 hypothetical protein [Brevibacillus sp. SYP-B805]